MEMVTQMGKFSPKLAQLSQPLRALLSTKQTWCWEPKQQEAFTLVKEELTKPSTLAYYDPAAETKVSADASSHGLGAVMLQMAENIWRLVHCKKR